jgi:hypothetical protein
VAKDERARQRPALQEAGNVNAYVDLSIWRTKHIPWLIRPEGLHIFFRLVTGRQSAIADMYANAGASQPVVHKTLMELSRAGLVKIRVDEEDARRHVVLPTPQLHQLALAYVQMMMFFLT